MVENSLLADIRTATVALIRALSDDQRRRVLLPFDDAVRRRFSYLPGTRPGASLGALPGPARKAAHQLLASVLSPPAYAQAAAVMALEEVLDRQEGWRRGRHSNGFSVVAFGDPARDERWGWRFEGHHLSVTVTAFDGRLYATPLFFGANPARVDLAGRPVLRPLGPEEDIARELLSAMGPRARAEAIVADSAPSDIRSATSSEAPARIAPPGVAEGRLGLHARALLRQLIAVYLGRLPGELAAAEASRLDEGPVYFAWEGPLRPGLGHYYRIQAADLLIEYDNTANDANHAHTVLRRPAHDFGGDPLSAHLATGHGQANPPR